jgi:predicted KAP-like P-loop ATPase
MDHVEKDVPESQIPVAIQALLDVGDELLDPADDRGMFDLGNDTRVARPVYHLLKRVDRARRREVLGGGIRSSKGIAVQLTLLLSLDREANKPELAMGQPLLDADETKLLRGDWLERARVVGRETALVGHPKLPWILNLWRAWGDEAEVRGLCEDITRSDGELLLFLRAFVQHPKSIGLSDRSFKVKARLNPAWLTPYLDTEKVALRLLSLTERDAIPAGAKEAVARFLKEREMIAAGKDPDAFGWPDDD